MQNKTVLPMKHCCQKYLIWTTDRISILQEVNKQDKENDEKNPESGIILGKWPYFFKKSMT